MNPFLSCFFMLILIEFIRTDSIPHLLIMIISDIDPSQQFSLFMLLAVLSYQC